MRSNGSPNNTHPISLRDQISEWQSTMPQDVAKTLDDFINWRAGQNWMERGGGSSTSIQEATDFTKAQEIALSYRPGNKELR